MSFQFRPANKIKYKLFQPTHHPFPTHPTQNAILLFTQRNSQSDLSQKALTLAGVWFAGEYGDLLLRPCAALPAEEGVEGEEGVDGTAAEWVQPVLKDDDDDKKKGKGGLLDEGGSLSKAASFLSLGGSAGVGAAHHAVEAGEIVDLMSKIMKVFRGEAAREREFCSRGGERRESRAEQRDCSMLLVRWSTGSAIGWVWVVFWRIAAMFCFRRGNWFDVLKFGSWERFACGSRS